MPTNVLIACLSACIITLPVSICALALRTVFLNNCQAVKELSGRLLALEISLPSAFADRKETDEKIKQQSEILQNHHSRIIILEEKHKG